MSNSKIQFANWSMFSRTHILSGLAWELSLGLSGILAREFYYASNGIIFWSNYPLGPFLPRGFGNFIMMRVKVKWKLYILYQLACFWLQVIENYDSAGSKNEEK